MVHRKILMLDTQLAYGDVTPFVEKPLQALNSFIFTWEEVGFGISRAYGLVFPLIQFLFVFLFRSSVLAQKMYVLVLPIIAFISFNHFLSFITGKEKNWLTSWLSFFYAFCPISLGEFMGGSLYSTMLIFAMFPFLYQSSFLLLKNPTLKRVVIHGLLIALYASTYIHIVLIYFLTLLVPFIIDLFKEKFGAVKKWLNFFFSALVALLVNPILFLSSFNILKNTNSGQETRSFVDYAPQFLQEMKITYESGKLFSALRLGSMGAFDFHRETWWTYPFFLIVLFVLFFALYRVFILKKKEKILLISLINYLAITFFIFATHKEWSFIIFRKIPVLFMFRNPSKLIYVSTFFFYIILYFATVTFLKIKIKNILKYLLLSVLLIIHLIYIWPIYLGDRGLAFSRESNFTIPKHFYSIAKTLKDNKADPYYRNTWLPLGHESTFNKLVWLDRNKLDAQIGIKEFAGSAFEHDVLSTTYAAVTDRDPVTFVNSLKLAQVEYLVLLKDDFYYNLLNFNLEDFLYVLKDVELLESTEKYDIYHIATKIPLIYSPQKFLTTNIQGAGDYYILSKEEPNQFKTLVPINKVMEHQIDPVKYYFFLFYEGSPKLVTNTQWQNHWEWKTPKIFPNIPENPTRDTETIKYLDDSMAAMAEISEYVTSNKNIPNAEKQSLVNSYFNILGIYIDFLKNIPPERMDNTIKTYFIKMYLYTERSLEKLREAGLANAELENRYETFSETLNEISSIPCEFDYCFNFGLTENFGYEVEMYDVNDDSLNNKFFINGRPFDLKERTNSEKWVSLGNIYFQKGEYETGINLNLENKPYTYDKESKTITIQNDKTLKYKNTFLYSFDEDVFVTVTYTPKKDYHNNRPYLVWKGTLANTKNSNFCYKKENGKCYRIFLSKLQPTNSYADVKFEFDKKITIDEPGPLEIREFTTKELFYPTLLLKDEAFTQAEDIPDRPIPDIEFEKINPTKYKIKLSNISNDFMLVFNQSYNTEWFLQDANKEKIAQNRHFKVNYFANAWWIKTADLNNSSEAELTLIFDPQKRVYVSLTMTVIALSASFYVITNNKLSKKKIIK